MRQRVLLPDACPGVRVEDALVIARAGDGSIHVYENRCRHEGGVFELRASCRLVCPRHGWELDPFTGEYVNPKGGIRQQELRFTVDGAETVIVKPPLGSERPWDRARFPQPLATGELTIRFLGHACVVIRCGTTSVVTDPWIVGPAFVTGWWPSHAAPAEALDVIAEADLVFLSHNHPDHLHPETLRALASRNPDLAVLVPDFPSSACMHMTRAAGLHNVRSAPFDEWLPIGEDVGLAIFEDGSDRQDSGFVLGYKDHFIVNTVDCTNPASGELPNDVDVLLTSYAGGASGYPVCWDDLYDVATIRAMVALDRRTRIASKVQLVKQTNARTYVPFAGSFVESHPADTDVRSLNVKNSAEGVAATVERECPATRAWVPWPGAEFDIGTGAEIARGECTEPVHDFETYDALLALDAEFPPLNDERGLATYFRWTGFSANIVLHVIETDQLFASVVREFMVDFASGARLVDRRPPRPHRYLRMRVRSKAFRHVLRRGLSWENLSIGFQARFYREPDVYNFDFWDHFHNGLPVTAPWAEEDPDVDAPAASQ